MPEGEDHSEKERVLQGTLGAKSEWEVGKLRNLKKGAVLRVKERSEKILQKLEAGVGRGVRGKNLRRKKRKLKLPCSGLPIKGLGKKKILRVESTPWENITRGGKVWEKANPKERLTALSLRKSETEEKRRQERLRKRKTPGGKKSAKRGKVTRHKKKQKQRKEVWGGRKIKEEPNQSQLHAIVTKGRPFSC